MPLDKINRGLNTFNRTMNNVSQTSRSVGRMKTNTNKTGGMFTKKAKPEAESWVCKCGAQNTAKFCGECGSAPAMCPKCKIRVESKFCQECGTAIPSEE